MQGAVQVATLYFILLPFLSQFYLRTRRNHFIASVCSYLGKPVPGSHLGKQLVTHSTAAYHHDM